MEPTWFGWARRLNALAQTGLTFAENQYDIERYTAIRRIVAEMIAYGSRSRCRVRHAER
jgi:Hydrolase of X-linked nucleoside diphosphate N terminal